jgi:hypothetical protein
MVFIAHFVEINKHVIRQCWFQYQEIEQQQAVEQQQEIKQQQ